jgi:hypothetical protein
LTHEKTPAFTIRLHPGKEPLRKILEANHNHFENDIKLLKSVNDMLGQISEGYDKRLQEMQEKISEMDDEGKKQIHNLRHVNRLSVKEITHPAAVELMSNFVDLSFLTGRIPMFMREMSLVYLIISFEAFLGIALNNIFSNKPEALKSEKKISYEEVLDFKNIADLKDAIFEREIKAILYDGIDGINTHLKRRLYDTPKAK